MKQLIVTKRIMLSSMRISFKSSKIFYDLLLFS